MKKIKPNQTFEDLIRMDVSKKLDYMFMSRLQVPFKLCIGITINDRYYPVNRNQMMWLIGVCK